MELWPCPREWKLLEELVWSYEMPQTKPNVGGFVGCSIKATFGCLPGTLSPTHVSF